MRIVRHINSQQVVSKSSVEIYNFDHEIHFCSRNARYRQHEINFTFYWVKKICFSSSLLLQWKVNSQSFAGNGKKSSRWWSKRERKHYVSSLGCNENVCISSMLAELCWWQSSLRQHVMMAESKGWCISLFTSQIPLKANLLCCWKVIHSMNCFLSDFV